MDIKKVVDLALKQFDAMTLRAIIKEVLAAQFDAIIEKMTKEKNLRAPFTSDEFGKGYCMALETQIDWLKEARKELLDQ